MAGYDAIVIGAGIIGAAVGLELSRKGFKTLNVDRLPAAGYGSTSNSCAIIRTYYSTVDGSAMAFEGYHYWHDWAGYIGAADTDGLAVFHECGTLVMKVPHNGFMARTMEIADELGIDYEELDAEALARRMPMMCLDEFAPARRPGDAGFCEPSGGPLAGAVFFPQGGYVNDPQLATRNIQRAAEAAGCRFRFNAEVGSIDRAGGRVAGITLAGGERIAAAIVVNVAGPHSAKINRLAGLDGTMKIGTRALRHEVPHVPAPPDYDFASHAVVTSDSDIATYTRPASGGRILIGSEDPECDPRDWVDPDDFDRNLSEQSRIQTLRVAQRFPALGIPEHIGGVVDLYDVSDDWIPVYDRSDLPGFYLAIGTSGNQFKNAPVAGAMMAGLIEACENGRDHDTDPVRYRFRYLDREVSIGFYSRNREVNPDSSFSVLG